MEQALKSLTTADGRFAELVLHGPDGWRVARLVLDPWSVALFSSRGPAFAEVERLKAGGLSTVEAIDRIAGAERPTVVEAPDRRARTRSDGERPSPPPPDTERTETGGNPS